MTPEQSRILVVDDDLVISQILAKILATNGFAVETATNGREALEKVRGGAAFSLIISDLFMPVMDGHELIREIRSGGSDVPIIVLSANNEITIALEALNSGANDYVPKDQNLFKTLMISVERVLEKYHLVKKNLQLMEDIARKNKELEKERLLAQRVQENILPKRLDIPDYPTGTFYRASNQIGGDFFDALDCGDRVHFLIGDISGHNTSSALLMAVCKGMFRTLGQTVSDPLEIVSAANRMLCPMLTESWMFLSLVYLTVERSTGMLRLVSAGHNPVFLISGNGIRAISSGGPVLGWDEDDTWEVEQFPFSPGDILFLYTDGLVETTNAAGIPFERQLTDRLLTRRDTPPELTSRIFAELSEFSGDSFEDDITIFAIGRDLQHV